MNVFAFVIIMSNFFGYMCSRKLTCLLKLFAQLALVLAKFLFYPVELTCFESEGFDVRNETNVSQC